MAMQRDRQPDQQSERDQRSPAEKRKSSGGGDVARPIESAKEPPARRSALLNAGRLVTPWELMRRMHAEVERLVDEVERQRGLSASQQGTRSPATSNGSSGTSDLLKADWVPRIEVAERDGAMVVRAELPGVKSGEIDVDVDNGVLSISGERRQERTEDDAGVVRTERVYGTFFRAIPLPEGAVEDQVTAAFRDGVLEVTIPLEERGSGRRVQVRSD